MYPRIILKTLALLTCLMCSFNTVAQEAYTEFNENQGIMRFYYDDMRSNRTGITYDIPESSFSDPAWYNDYTYMSVHQVVFTPSFANARPTMTSRWFIGMENLESIAGMQYLNTEDVTDMSFMFSGCSSLTNIDLSHFNTENVLYMGCMFGGCSSLTSINLSHFNTTNVGEMDGMFGGCSSLTSLDLTSFNTENVYNMSSMFENCTGLTSLDLSNFNTSSVGSMSMMFSCCYNLASINLTSFNTEHVTDINGMFQLCYSLKSLDLSSFNTAKVEMMWYLFNCCWNLETIYVGSGWSTDAATVHRLMFNSCNNLVGGKGTTYDPSFKDKTYAHIDGGPTNPGYFTSKVEDGDVSGDGEIDITDVTLLINAVLTGNLEDVDAAYADCNVDGIIDITDVTMLISRVLTGAW